MCVYMCMCVISFVVFFRLVNIGEKAVKVDLSNLFDDITFVSAVESTPDFTINMAVLKGGAYELPPYKLASVVLTLKI